MVSSVNNIKAINTANQTSSFENTKKLIKYVNNQTLQDIPDTFTSSAKNSLSSAGLFEGLPFVSLLKRNKKLNGLFVNDAMKELGKTNQAALQELLHGEGKLTSRIHNYLLSTNDSKKAYSQIKSAVKAESKAAKAAKKAVKSAADATAEVVERTVTESTKEAAKKGVLKKGLKSAVNALGSTKLGKGLKSLAKGISGKTAAIKSTKIGKFLKSSGAGAMLVFSGIVEGVTEVVPTFKELGKEKGLKQLGKSAIKVAGDTAGFIAGEQAGVAIGTAIGTAICPGIGSAIGAACGFVGGLLGSFVAGKITKAVTGKSEREIAKENEEQQNASKIAADENSLNELKEQAALKIKAEAEYGELSEDGKIALEALENLEDSNPFAA